MGGLSLAGRSFKAMISASRGARFLATVFFALGTASSPCCLAEPILSRLSAAPAPSSAANPDQLQIVFTSSNRREGVSRSGVADGRYDSSMAASPGLASRRDNMAVEDQAGTENEQAVSALTDAAAALFGQRRDIP